MRKPLLIAAWTVCAALRVADALVRPSELFMPAGQQTALLVDAVVVGVVEDALQGVGTADACAEECRAALPACSFFSFCKQAGGCSTQTYGDMPQGECLLLSRNCTLPADREEAPGAVSGFPIHNYPGPVLEAFPTYLAQAIIGADFPCPRSDVEGICAFKNPMNAMFNCVRLASSCVAVTVYANGTNGCSDEPLAVLKSAVPTNANSFMSGAVYTIAFTEAQKALRTLFLFADQAELDLPSEEEILATGADEPDSLQYKGCQIGDNALYHGDIVGVVDDVPSARDCCRECAARNVNATRRVCTVFNYCGRPGGCAYDHKQDESLNVVLEQGQCQLRYQPLSSSVTSLPPSLLAIGDGVPFEAGAPNALWAPEVPGYTRLPGETIALSGAFACQGSLRPETGECLLPGTLQQSADFCTRTKECAAFSYRPGPHNDSVNSTQGGGGGATPMLTSFKGYSESPNQVVFPTAVMYQKKATATASGGGGGGNSSSSSDSGDGGLSGGAIAGIAVGAAAGAAALACCAWLLLRQRQRGRQPLQLKGGEEAAPPSSTQAGGGSCGSVGALRSASSMPRCSPGSAGSGSRRQSTSGASAEAIPELVAHVAAQEAALLTQGTLSPQSSGQAVWDEALLLPPHLRASIVDVSQVAYQRRPNGKLWEIGAGASGRVYRVEYRGEVLAAKEVELGGSQSLRETFVREAHMLHQLRHPNVIGFAGVTFHGTKGVVLMELCDGRDLHSALELTAAGSQQRLFGWHRRGKRVALEVAKAINFLHQNNVVHMDIKSPNILLTAAGTAKLADCGFSKTKHDSFLSSVSLVGTFAWAAPELLLGNERPTAAVDVYSFGVVLFEIITGERPQRGQLRLPLDDECPAEVRALMLECLAEKPAARPTALQVLQRLRAVVEGVSTPPPAGDHAAGGAADADEAAAAANRAAPPAAGAPLRVVPGMSVQLGPTPRSPFAS